MLQILGYIIPALVVFATVVVILHIVFRNEDKKRQWEMKKQSQKEITNVRLRAYERLILLLERTQPEHLLMDIDMTSMTPMTLQQHLLKTIRMEFDHNLSQQIYVEDETWDKIIQARDEMAAFVNTMAIQLPKEANVMDYAKVLMTAYRNNGITPHQIAISDLKDEVRAMLDR